MKISHFTVLFSPGPGCKPVWFFPISLFATEPTIEQRLTPPHSTAGACHAGIYLADSSSTFSHDPRTHVESLSCWPPSVTSGQLSFVACSGVSGLEGSRDCIRGDAQTLRTHQVSVLSRWVDKTYQLQCSTNWQHRLHIGSKPFFWSLIIWRNWSNILPCQISKKGCS